MTAKVVTWIVFVTSAAAAAWAGSAVLDSLYDLRRFGSPYGFLDLQVAGSPAIAQHILESWSVAAGTAVFDRARAHARWEMLLYAGHAAMIVTAFLLLRTPLRRERHTPSGWHVSDRFAALLDELVAPAMAATVVGAVLGVVANLIYHAALATAKNRGPAAAVGANTVVANTLSLALLLLSAFGVFVLTACALYCFARNRSPRLKEFIEVVRVTRFSLLTVAAVGVGLCIPDQLRDAFRALAEGHWLRMVVTEIVLAAWAFTVWYAGRFLLNVSFETAPVFGGPPESPRELWGERYWPRIVGVAAFLLFALATWLAYYEVADSPEIGYPALLVLTVLNVALGGAFWAFTRFRRAMVAKITGRFDSPRGRAYRHMPPQVQWLVRGTGMIVLALWLIVFFVPQWIAPYVGTVALLLGASITITMMGSLVVWAGERAKIPAVSILFAFAVIFSLGNDNHSVRRLSDAPRPPRLEIGAHVKDWSAWIERKYPAETHPLFVVSAAGGGIRAAYWTATVLARLQDLNPAFADHTLLISGVSGGSLGALVFANLVDTTPPGGDWRGKHASFGASASEHDKAECPYPQHQPGKYQALAATILARDFLAPTVASMLYGDFLARLLPYSLLTDRAQALEVAWEHAWDAVMAEPPEGIGKDQLWRAGNPFARSFDALHASTAMTSDRATAALYVPLIVLNGTIVESGARIVVSHLRHPPSFKGDVENAFDHRDAPMRMSTAALMSARFTYVSPAGTYAPGTHVVDGGYFENSGAVTALQWWAEAEKALRELESAAGEAKKGRVVPVFIYIDNGSADVTVRPAPPSEPEPRRSEVRERRPALMPELGAPVAALLAARSAHAVEAKTRARHEFDRRFVAIDTNAPSAVLSSGPLPPAERLNRAPLGWVLSRSAQHVLDRALCRNAERLAEIVARLPKSAGR